MESPRNGSQPTPVSTTGTVLEVRNLSVVFSVPGGSIKAVNNVSLELGRSRTLGIVGESGSGKSALARAIMGVLPRNASIDPRSAIVYGGQNLLALKPAEVRRILGPRIGMVFQDPLASLNPVLRVGEQISEPIRVHMGLSRSDAKDKALQLLAQVGISDPEWRLTQYPHNLSGGMRQRVMLAIALSCSPDLLLADEPTTALDVTVQQQILNLLKRTQAERNMAMLLITHNFGVVARMADDVAVMYGGRVVEQGPIRNVFRAMRHPYTRALFDSIPKIETEPHSKLITVGGQPAVVTEDSRGCTFAPRCPRARECCLIETPPLQSGPAEDHSSACFYPIDVPVKAEAVVAGEPEFPPGDRG